MLRRTNRDKLINARQPANDKIYWDVLIQGLFQYEATDASIALNRNVNVLNKSSDYYATVESMTVPTTYLPIYNFVQFPAGTAPYVSYLIWRIDRTDLDDNKDSFFQAMDFNYITRPVQSSNQVISNDRYFTNSDKSVSYSMFSVLDFVDCANQALAKLVTQTGGDDENVMVKLFYDHQTNGFRLWFSDSWFTSPDDYVLFMSPQLRTILPNVVSYNTNARNTGFPFTNGWQIVTSVNRMEPGYFLDNEFNLIEGYEFTSTPNDANNLECISRILVVCGDLPVGITLKDSDQSAYKILLSFIPKRNIGDSHIHFNSGDDSYSYRDLITEQELRSATVIVRWIDNMGIVRPMWIGAADVIPINICFTKKQLLNNFYRSDEPV